MQTERRLELQMLVRSATVAPSTLDAAARTVEVVAATSTPLERVDPYGEPYLEQLSLEPRHVRMDRLTGGPVLRDHNRSTEAQIGVVRRAWLTGSELRAVIEFSPRAEPFWQDVQRGILRDVSVGARVFKMQETKPKGSALPLRTATDWEPIEISFVTVGMDAGATVRSESKTQSCVIVSGGNMEPDPDLVTTPTAATPTPASTPKASHVKEIRRLATDQDLGDAWALDMIERALPIEDVRRAALSELARRDEQFPVSPRVAFGHDFDRGPDRLDAMAEGVAARYQPRIKPTERAQKFISHTLPEIAFEVLRACGHRTPDARNRGKIIERALTTSDFPLLLADAANKVLLPEFFAANPTYRKIAAKKEFNDFKPHKFLRAGDFPAPLKVGEDGEIKFGSMSESREQITLATYGRRVGLARAAIINDDAGAFFELAGKAGRRIADFENATFFAVLTTASGAGPALADGVALFHATHANLGAAAAISVDELGKGRAAMQKQTSLDGLKLNIEPAVLLTSPDKRTLAEQYVAQLAPTIATSANPFSGVLGVASDANLASANPWYLFADPAQNPAFVYGYLTGSSGPRVETRQGFEIEGVEMKVAVDFACGVIDFRSAWRNPGA